jgi:hypothetical protein
MPGERGCDKEGIIIDFGVKQEVLEMVICCELWPTHSTTSSPAFLR